MTNVRSMDITYKKTGEKIKINVMGEDSKGGDGGFSVQPAEGYKWPDVPVENQQDIRFLPFFALLGPISELKEGEQI